MNPTFHPVATVAVNDEEPVEAPIIVSYMLGIYPVATIGLPDRKFQSGDTMIIRWTITDEGL